MSERRSVPSQKSGKRSTTGNAQWLQALKATRSQAPSPEVNQGLQSSSQALDEKTRGFFEQRFGHDLGNVRIHADHQAARSADALQAEAYTAGADIVFGAGRYQPQTSEGRSLLAHELAHVTQQRQPVRPGGNFQLSRPESVAERAAEVSAQRISTGLAPPLAGIAQPGVIYRTIKDDLRRAIAGWGTDEEAIYNRIQNSSPDEKTAVLSDPVLMQDLYDDLSRSEWGRVLRLLGAGAESRVQAASEGWGTDEDAIYDALRDASATDLKRQLETSTMLMQLRDELNDDELGRALAIIAQKYYNEATITFEENFHILVVFPDVIRKACQHLTNLGVSPASDIIANLHRGHLMAAATVDDINTFIENDNSLSRVQAAFEARWNLSLTSRAGTTGPAPNWTVDKIRQIHHALQQVPAGHVTRAAQNIAGIASGEVASFQIDALKPNLGAWDASRGTILVGTEFGDLAGLTRHEVGHAVDSFLGATTVAFKQNAVNGWQWSNLSTTWENAMPNPWRRRNGTLVPVADQTAIKTLLDAYIQTDGSGALRAGTPPGHSIRTYWNDNVPMIEAAKKLAGKKDKVWNDLGSVMKIGGQYYSWSAYYNEFYVYNTIVQDRRLTDYSLFGHPEFFAELYEAYYEEGTGPRRGQKLRGVPNWKQFFDNTVHTTVET